MSSNLPIQMVQSHWSKPLHWVPPIFPVRWIRHHCLSLSLACCSFPHLAPGTTRRCRFRPPSRAVTSPGPIPIASLSSLSNVLRLPLLPRACASAAGSCPLSCASLSLHVPAPPHPSPPMCHHHRLSPPHVSAGPLQKLRGDSTTGGEIQPASNNDGGRPLAR
jgi:hypothetical protein